MLQFQTMGVVSDVKVNILGALYRLKVNIVQQFSKKSRKTKKKMTEKREFLRKTIPYDSNFYEICRKRENSQD
ncbi:hypothetical protein FWK35_00024816 [Aphis craccivora]|uniref:Uncharacterized protein n=1 Tax=Aphis craccivora TaxID=307492 RepID=A0A6G0XUB6_APHCR|nr:hypothetical protein FWK35_00024816 [Aphis craccivora]